MIDRNRVKRLIVGLLALTTFGTAFLPATVAQSAVGGSLAQCPNGADWGTRLFYDSSFAVVPGSTVSLHWSGGSVPLLGEGVHFVVTSTLPGFSSGSVVKWPTVQCQQQNGTARGGSLPRRG